MGDIKVLGDTTNILKPDIISTRIKYALVFVLLGQEREQPRAIVGMSDRSLIIGLKIWKRFSRPNVVQNATEDCVIDLIRSLPVSLLDAAFPEKLRKIG